MFRCVVAQVLCGARSLCRSIQKRLTTGSSLNAAEENLTLYDPVHHQLDLDPRLKHIIDSPYLQRLRTIKQLGATCYVYPSAVHTRFEHTVGTAYLAVKMVQSLEKAIDRDRGGNPQVASQTKGVQPEPPSDKDYLCVAVAALCHDLGHGPFSHVFDTLFMRRLKLEEKPKDQRLWKHEDRSVEILKVMMKQGGLQEKLELEESHLRTIYRMIASPPKFDDPWTEDLELPEGKSYLYEIVANKITEIDVDKIDYLLRDSHCLGLPGKFEWRRYFENIAVRQVPVRDGGVRNQICSRRKEAHNLYDLFHNRMMLHRRAYQHKTTTAVQLMMTDALLFANKSIQVRGAGERYYTLGQAAGDPHAFLRLTDAIQQLILSTPRYSDEIGSAESIERDMRRLRAPLYVTPSPLVNQAQEILRRIERRKLYTYIGRSTIADAKKYQSCDECVRDIEQYLYEEVPELKTMGRLPHLSEISEHCEPLNSPSNPLHIYVAFFGYASKDPNASPLKNHYVYEKREGGAPQQLRTISKVLPSKFMEWEAYVYYRPEVDPENEKHTELVQELRRVFKYLRDNRLQN